MIVCKVSLLKFGRLAVQSPVTSTVMVDGVVISVEPPLASVTVEPITPVPLMVSGLLLLVNPPEVRPAMSVTAGLKK